MKPKLFLLWLALGTSGALAPAATLPPSAALETDASVCIDVDGDQILGSDMARAFPAFRALPQEIHIAPVPVFGGTRIFSEPELVSLGARFGIRVSVVPQPVCFRVPAAPLSREAVLAAMRLSLPSPNTRIDLADVSPEPVPPGVIQFPLGGLIHPALVDTPALWRGEVVAGSRHFTIWAKAKISTPLTRLVAVEDLRPGQIVQANQIRAELYDGFPVVKTGPPTIQDVTGMMPLRTVSAGSEIRPEYMVRPFDVARGDLVHVEVRMGKARLSLRGRAEAAGRVGDVISVRNPESNTIFRARVEGKDIVLVDPQRSGAE
jgi:flagella basal body P-ring formation protein FlgA